MAEINSNADKQQKTGVRKTKKLSTRVDLTPMVDLGFLLITFFVFTASMAKPKAIKINLPTGDEQKMPIPETTILTIIPLQRDSIYYYNGKLEDALKTGDYGISNFDFPNGIGAIIREKQKRLDAHPNFEKDDLILIIKPSERSTHQNITDAMDEALINDVKRYGLVDIEKEELAVLPHR